jgi:hypothetical protein
MRSFIVSTIVFFPASFFLHRYLDNWGLDSGKTRTMLVLLLASIVAYGIAYLVDLIFV